MDILDVEETVATYFTSVLADKFGRLDVSIDFGMENNDFDRVPNDNIVTCDIEISLGSFGINPSKRFDHANKLYATIYNTMSRNKIIKLIRNNENQIYYDERNHSYLGNVYLNSVHIMKSDILNLA